MSRSAEDPTSLRRAIVLTTTSSAIVPIAGLLTQPLLAQGLGVEGRGELAAAVAPSALVLGAATLGLPEALLYLLAKHPEITRRAITAGAVITTVLGLVCLAGTVVALPFLSDGQDDLANYILIAMAIAVPALIVGTLRGAAMGRQMWRAVALERVSSTMLRLGVLGALFWTDRLTVLNAVVATVAIPALCGVVYWRLAVRPVSAANETAFPDSVARTIISYGSRIWLGAVAAVLLSRTDQILMVPLSTVEDLGIYSVANVISDVPFLIVTAIAGALAGTSSRSGDSQQVARTTRLTLLLGASGSVVLAALVPIFLVPLFGSDFKSAIIPTIILLGAALTYAPGFIASAGLSSFGRPGLRSIGFCIALTVNVIVFVATVPKYGAVGACWASVVTALVFSVVSIASASQVLRIPAIDFVLSTRADFADIWSGVRAISSRSMKIIRRRT